MIESTEKKVRQMPLIPLRGITVFPYMILHFDVGRKKSVKALENAMLKDQIIFLTAQKKILDDKPGFNDMYDVGTIAKVKQILRMPGSAIKVLVEGIKRAKMISLEKESPFFIANIEEINEYKIKENNRIEALKRKVIELFEEYVSLSGKVSPDAISSIVAAQETERTTYLIASSIFLNVEEKQDILSENDVVVRLEKLLSLIDREIKILSIENDINKKVKNKIDKNQKEYYLREQLKEIQNQLGDTAEINEEIEGYYKKLNNINFSDECRQKVIKEIKRLKKVQPGSAESGVIRTYLEWVFDMPWNEVSVESLDLENAEKILENDHYGLEKVKERIIEHLASRKKTGGAKSPILCLVGPPGVGKTSIAKSIARAANRKYVRMSLGGVRDEAEIRGHRRTYIGSMPGRIIKALKRAQTKNPLMLFDEIDKMSSDFRGDPSSAMLEVLDSEQNFAFRDHYLELPFDLSDVMFITTANSLYPIPKPLLDRMEVIHISGYTEEEKVKIAQRYLIPKQYKEHGLKKKELKISEAALREIINGYTKEAGVRNLERSIGTLCRKSVRKMMYDNIEKLSISLKNLEDFLGVKKYRFDPALIKDEIGIARGLAWTPVGGDTLSIEVNTMPGNGKIELTGRLGDVMQESAKTAISYIRSRIADFEINPKFYSNTDIHIHVPEGAVPKDGPSAGITLATAVISALAGIGVKHDVAMTGEITLRGRVLAIGGLKEKVLAANRAGINTIILPADNIKDIEEIPENVREKIKFIPVKNMDKVIKNAIAGDIGRKTPIYNTQDISDNDKKTVDNIQMPFSAHSSMSIKQ